MKRILIFLAAVLLFIQIASAQTQIPSISPTMQKSSSFTTQTQCRAEADLWNDMEACKKQGMDYTVYVDQNRCKRVKCVQTDQPVTCPSNQELEQKVQACKAKNLGFEYYSDSNQCTQVQCTGKQSACPAKEELDARAGKCLAAGLEPYYYTNDMGCRMVNCKETAPSAVNCKKTMEGNCAIISCEDGLTYNTCSGS